MNEPSHSSPPTLWHCSPVLSSARHRGADGVITGCELCLSLPYLGKVLLPSHCTPWGATGRLVSPPDRVSPDFPTSPWLRVPETLGEVTHL